ncbi:MAG: aldehyde dehydrogenase [Alistipes sp.]|nr:aldehyde dehydrogenase [Alistipes sp.]
MAIENTSKEKISALAEQQRAFFNSEATLSYEFRLEQLRKFRRALKHWHRPLCDALWSDLHKSEQEAVLTELSIVEGEVKNHIRHLKGWMRGEKCSTPLKMMPSKSYVVSEPLGCALIIAPWNYPVQLLLNPLVGAISAGCTALLKPSPYVPTVSQVLSDMIAQTFDEEYVAAVQGNRDVNKALLEQRWDTIFFTGSPALGRVVMEAASKHLTPVVLELGGKSPCIVDKGADVKIAARRIAWGKCLNAGQTCIAPDFVWIHSSLKEKFVEQFGKAIRRMYGKDIRSSRHYVRLVNDRAFERVAGYMGCGEVLYGGEVDAAERFIEPTLLGVEGWESPVMQEEIFGPVLPVLCFDDVEDVVREMRQREKPLALYYFGKPKRGEKVIGRTTSGGACINDTIMHIANENLPFGGVGNSGMGAYHGRLSFDAFSHRRAVVVSPRKFDIPFRYMPYKLFKLIKHFL